MTYRNRRIERDVLEFLKTLPPSYLKFPFDVVTSINTLKNCKIHSYQDFAKIRNITIDDVIDFCESSTGCTHKYRDNFIIMFNDSKSVKLERKLFTIAHELGHIISGHFNDIKYQQIAQDAFTNKTKEREANHFAACLLCPLPIVYQTKPKSINDIQNKFGLSGEAAEIAWNDLINYDKHYYTAWHNDVIRLFDNV